MGRTFTCESCGGTFTAERPEEEAHAEAVALWGRRGDAPGMAVICDACFRAGMERDAVRDVVRIHALIQAIVRGSRS